MPTFLPLRPSGQCDVYFVLEPTESTSTAHVGRLESLEAKMASLKDAPQGLIEAR